MLHPKKHYGPKINNVESNGSMSHILDNKLC